MRRDSERIFIRDRLRRRRRRVRRVWILGFVALACTDWWDTVHRWVADIADAVNYVVVQVALYQIDLAGLIWPLAIVLVGGLAGWPLLNRRGRSE